MNQSYQPREGYWDYMSRRLREEEIPKSAEELWKREVAEMQKQVHELQMRVVKLGQEVYELRYKVTLLGGDPNQLEFRF